MTILKVLPNFNQVSFRNNSNKISFKESSGPVLTSSIIEDSFVKEKDNKKRNILIASGVGVALLICAYFAGRKGLLGDAIKKFLTGAKNNGGSAINPPAGGNTGVSTDGSVVEEINTGVKKLIRKRRDGTLLKEIEKNEKGDVTKILYYDKSGKNVKETIEVLGNDRYSSTNHVNNTVTILTKDCLGSKDGRMIEVIKDNFLIKSVSIHDGVKDVNIYDPKATTDRKFKIVKRERIDLESGRRSLDRLNYNPDGSYTMSHVGKDGYQTFRRFNKNGFLTSRLEKDNNGNFIKRTKYKYKLYQREGIPYLIRLEKSTYKDSQGVMHRTNQFMDKIEPLRYKYEQEIFDVAPDSRDIVIYRRGKDLIELAGKVKNTESFFTDTEGVTLRLAFDPVTGKKLYGSETMLDGTQMCTKSYHPFTQEMTRYIRVGGLEYRDHI